jgi:uncharacterized membrane protein YqiK
VDVGAGFYMKVESKPQDIEGASRGLGDRSLNSESLRMLLEEKLVSALRVEAAEKNLVEIPENRIQFAREMKRSLREPFFQMGLHLRMFLYSTGQTKKDQLAQIIYSTQKDSIKSQLKHPSVSRSVAFDDFL